MKALHKHILLLTATNLACNPRCLKELRLLNALDLKVTVVAFNLHNWTNEKEKELNNEFPSVEFNYLESTRRFFFPWIYASFLERISRIVLIFFPEYKFWAAMAISKRSWLLLKWTKKSNLKPDLIIGHNPAAFYPAFSLSQQLNIPFALDIEDFHPGEYGSKLMKKSVSFLMRTLLLKTVYTSFASPLIKQYSENLVNSKLASFLVVNNIFPKSEFIEPAQLKPDNEKIKLIWISQYIDYNRGLEKILPVLEQFQDQFTLTVIGNIRQNFYNNEVKKRKFIIYKNSMPHEKLQKELSKYDVGLAIEDVSADLNRNICLTNKIWSYFQAGLFIMAADTAAQKLFIEEHPLHGICTPLAKESLYVLFEKLVNAKESIRSLKKERFGNASLVNWENESRVLIKEWDTIIWS